MSCEWEGVSTTSSGAPTTACLSEPALKPEYSSGASVAGSVRSVGMAESEDGSLHSTTTTTGAAGAAKQAQNAHPTAAAPAQEHQAAASSLVAAEPAGLASAGSAASFPAAKGAEEERAEAEVVGSGQQAGSGASWADMADDDDEEEEQQQEEESAGQERQQEGDAEAATAAEDVDSAAAAEPKQQQQQQRASLTPAAVSPAAPPDLTSAAAVSSAAQVKLKVPSPLPLPMVQRPSGAMPTVEYRDASTSPLPTSLLPQAQPACQPAPAAPASAPQAAAYHPHHGASHHTLPLPPPPPPPPGFCPPPSPRAAYGPAGAHPQQPGHPSAASSIRAAVGRHPIAAQAPAQPAFMQRMSYPGTVDLTLVPAFTCPLTGHLFVNPGTGGASTLCCAVLLWAVVGWDGMGWDGMGRDGLLCAKAVADLRAPPCWPLAPAAFYLSSPCPLCSVCWPIALASPTWVPLAALLPLANLPSTYCPSCSCGSRWHHLRKRSDHRLAVQARVLPLRGIAAALHHAQ